MASDIAPVANTPAAMPLNRRENKGFMLSVLQVAFHLSDASQSHGATTVVVFLPLRDIVTRGRGLPWRYASRGGSYARRRVNFLRRGVS
jgi:hypothetical protein